jgi:hypothetical protein
MQEQEAEEGAEPLSVQGDDTATLDDRQRSENAEFDGNTTGSSSALLRPIGPRLEAG